MKEGQVCLPLPGRKTSGECTTSYLISSVTLISAARLHIFTGSALHINTWVAPLLLTNMQILQSGKVYWPVLSGTQTYPTVQTHYKMIKSFNSRNGSVTGDRSDKGIQKIRQKFSSPKIGVKNKRQSEELQHHSHKRYSRLGTERNRTQYKYMKWGGDKKQVQQTNNHVLEN